MLLFDCSMSRGNTREVTRARTRTMKASTRAGPGSVRRHRSKIILAILLTACIGEISSFRGPHHPRSSVSHHHYVPVESVKLTQDEELLHDMAHLAEDMGSLAEQIDVTKMSPQELEFYYFKVHDIDNNTKLDGLELLHALQHTLHEEDNSVEQTNDVDHEHVEHVKESGLDYSWIVEIIDRVLEEDDADNDGYLGYIEYVMGRQKDQSESTRRNMKLKI